MAKLKLKFHGLCAEVGGTNTVNMSLSTEKEAAELFGYNYSIEGFSMKKQMYQPVEVAVDIAIAKSTKSGWEPISRSQIETIFKFREVSLDLMNPNGIDVDNEIFNGFYVHEVIPEYLPDGMILRLKIYSLDKMLTLKQTSRTFVGKKLGDGILKNEVAKYGLPYDKTARLGYNTALMKRLKFKSLAEESNVKGILDKVKELTNPEKKEEKKEEKKGPRMVEHIFPYLVQYNESLYDMLARTTNRWGEFMYFEDGKLQIGYDDAQNAIKEIKNYHKITYSNKDTSDTLLEQVKDGNYEAEAAYDKNIYDNPVQKSPILVRGELGKFNGQGDKYAMKKLASFFNTDKNIVSWIVNTLVDDGVSVLQSSLKIGQKNDTHNEKYFPGKGTDEQYGKYTFTLYDKKTESKDAFNEFTEITSQYADKDEIYDAKRYGTTFDLEQKAGRNMAFIDFDTTWPGVKLGQIIKVNGELFIVVDVSAAYKNNQLTFQVKASGAHQYVDKEKTTHYDFYPAMIPTGHVRYSGPQMATIKDATDPASNHRVRVVFPWQGDFDKVDVKDATPWLPFAAKGEGKITTGKHNKEDQVIVGFIDGNVERPYVLGAVQTKAPGDKTVNVDLDTPGSHYMRLSDGTGAGLLKFISSAFSPLLDTFCNFFPVDKIPGLGKLLKDDKAWSGNKYFEGGVTMSDYYGIYKISGSTDKRNVTISSPWGDVKMDAFTGITISAPNGDVKITGKNVTIEAGNNLTLESGTNIGWKLGNDKKFGDLSAASLGLTVAAAIASKVAEKIKPIDLKIVRSVVEVVMRPVEGALTVKSNRFLKLEAGKKTCQYPTDAYSMKIRKRMYDDKEPELKESAGNATDGVVELIKKTDKLVPAMVEKWVKLYNDCISKKQAFEATIQLLDLYRNDRTKPSCKTYKELKDTFWAAGDKEISEADLGFTDNVKVDGDKNKIITVEFFMGLREDFVAGLSYSKVIERVVEIRKSNRENVLQAANDLRKAIVKVLKFEMTEKDAVSAIGPFRWTSVPKDSKKYLKNAVSREKCKDFPMYNAAFLDKYELKDLKGTMKMESTSPQIKASRRMICLNLIKELDLDFHRTKDANKQEIKEPTFDNILDDDHVWAPYVNSLNATSEKLKGAVTLKSALKDSFIKPIKEGVTVMNLKKAYDEMCSWSEGNKGQILIGTGDGTYYVDDKATMQKISTFYAYDLEVKDPNAVNEVTTFLKKVKAVLLNI